MIVDQLFTLEPNRWYAAEFIGDEFGDDLRSYSPLFVHAVVPLKTGRATIDLEFHHENYPDGVQRKRYTLEVLERQRRFLLARRSDQASTRLLLVSELTWPWLTRRFGLLPINDHTDPQSALGRR